jgi:hypothetical protein
MSVFVACVVAFSLRFRFRFLLFSSCSVRALVQHHRCCCLDVDLVMRNRCTCMPHHVQILMTWRWTWTWTSTWTCAERTWTWTCICTSTCAGTIMMPMHMCEIYMYAMDDAEFSHQHVITMYVYSNGHLIDSIG